MKKTLLILACVMALNGPAMGDAMLVDLNQRVQSLEDQNRELRGTVEELQHKNKVLSQRFDTLSSDIEMRFATQASKAPTQLSSAHQPMPLAASQPTADAQLAQPSSEKAEAVKRVTQLTPVEEQMVNPKEQYENARALLEKGDYTQAGNKFAEFLHNNPNHEMAANANYWIGVSYLLQGQYESAAGSFAKVYKTFPDSPKAPEALIKLAKSLAALGRSKDACTTLTQLSEDFPGKLEGERMQEWTTLGCS